MNDAPTIKSEPRTVGLLPEGITAALADTVAAKVRDAFLASDGSTVRAVRIVPSSLVNCDGFVEFVVNTTVEPKRSRPDGPAGRSKVIDSVVTLDLARGVVKGVSIPFLQREFA